MSYPMPPLAPSSAAPAVPMPSAAPTLPQDDTPAEQAARAAQLTATQAIYTWTTDVPTLPGVPLATAVPRNDEPTIAWFAILIGVGLEIVRNALTVKLGGVDKGELDSPRAEYEAALAECDAIEASTAKIAAEHGVHSGGNIFERMIGDVQQAVAAAERDAHVALLKGYKERIEELMKVDEALGLGSKTVRSIEAYRALFATLPVPGISYMFEGDAEFARLRVQGPNCMLIAAVGGALPANFPLSAAQYAAVVNGDTLAAALADGRLFLLDYKPLEVLDPGTYGSLAKYAWQPMALFAVPPGGSSLVPVAIQCGQDPADWPIFTPSPAADKLWGWEMAKFVVEVADGNYHELFTHLARTHLVIEAFAVATHRHLAEVHPVWALLVPHFEGTLFINEAAATSLIAANGPIDHIFAGTIASSQLAAVDARLAFDFYGKMPHADFAARGVGVDSALADYPYRDDALLVWDAIHEWARQYIDLYYAHDADVVADTELGAWAACLAGAAKIRGFGPVTTRKQLADVCAMVMFTASAQHAAVNFPQKDIMAFAPAITGAGWQAAPNGQRGHDKAGWLAMMPPMALALEQLNVLELLGSVHYRPLGDYRSNAFPYPLWFQDPRVTGAEGPLAWFQAALAGVEAEIVRRNAGRMQPYPYLQPSLIPTSINI
ncbi:arachidonate 15-lipoxygenase [Sphingopyxis sp. PAMC25046]|uniref:lipoxygenase family protein n=1 Tax=Sphingopyxis sp. PAMC25046 TaxID=2565556 RepID=UPI00109DD5C6|nr:lipoxygenase family protein [Sphingopyxis sp. PAMC25046]QCB53603.1 arachidonate 15-lipoxygenase [Sphingopyxis sp. PAMC25046]